MATWLPTVESFHAVTIRSLRVRSHSPNFPNKSNELCQCELHMLTSITHVPLKDSMQDLLYIQGNQENTVS